MTWTPERRERARRQANRYWSSPEGQRKRERLRQASIASFNKWAEENPDKAELVERTRAAIADGEIVPQPCAECGEPSKPIYDWHEMKVSGWRELCLRCFRKGQSRDSPQPPGDEGSAGPLGRDRRGQPHPHHRGGGGALSPSCPDYLRGPAATRPDQKENE